MAQAAVVSLNQRFVVEPTWVNGPPEAVPRSTRYSVAPDTADQVLTLLRERTKAVDAIGILVTHSRHAAATADRTYVLGREGMRVHGRG